jgi:3'(2'), 5'-bisphosphate nucleotidase
MAPYARERHLAELAVLRASILTKRIQSTVSGISKDDNSPVTIANFAAQALLIQVLCDAFLDDRFLGEEDSAALRGDEALGNEVYELVLSATDVQDFDAQGATLPKPASVEEMLDLCDLGGHGTRIRKRRFWVMDPIDGTATFLNDLQYAVSLALIKDGIEVISVLGCPNISADMTQISEGVVDKNGLGIMLTAVRGQGSTIRTMTLTGLENAIPLDILKPFSSNSLHIIDCAASKTCRHDVIAKFADQFEAVFPNTGIWSSNIRCAALVVRGGDVQFCVPASPASKMYIWDHAGSQLIFTELGGKVTDLDGKDIDFCAGRDLNRNRGLVMARGEIHKAILTAMNGILGEAGDVG